LKNNYLVLTGGLGNQLFQMAALNVLGGQHQNQVDIVNGFPRLGRDGVPDVLDFDLQKKFRTKMTKMPLVTRKAIGYCMRSHLTPTRWEKLTHLPFFALVATAVLVSLHFKRATRVCVASDLGYDSNFKISKGNNLLVGYFQSSKWASGLREQLDKRIALNIISPRLVEYQELARVEKPLIVHMRLGDYLDEGGFGIPSQNYYRAAINNLVARGSFEKIWLFSDEPDKAIDMLPPDLPIENRIIYNPDFSSAETLEVMRMGLGYVIANSTFSWWGAYLSYTSNPPVIYPVPWFKTVQPPRELTPETWEGLNADL
jgi:hypothetical protein